MTRAGNDKRARIEARICEGVAPKHIADEFGVSRAYVSQIRRDLSDKGIIERMPRFDGMRPNKLAKVPDKLFEKAYMNPKLKITDIAAALGVTEGAILRRAKIQGLSCKRPRGGSRRQKSDPEKFADLWNKGVKSSDIAKIFGYASISTVTTRRRALGLPPRRPEDQRLSEAQAYEIAIAEMLRGKNK